MADSLTTRPIKVRVVEGDGTPVSQAIVSVIESTVAFPEVALLPNSAGIVVLSMPFEAEFKVRAIASDGRWGDAVITGSARSNETLDIVVG